MSSRSGFQAVVLTTAVAGLWPASSSGQSAPPPREQEQPDHSAHQESTQTELPPGVPPITDEARRVAFPDVDGHMVHDNDVNYLVLVNQLEWQNTGSDSAASWDGRGWVGKDRDRLWFRTEGEGESDSLGDAEAHFLYGRAIARWWDIVAGVRQDVRPGPARTWAAFGVQGLAPYWFEVEATAYVGESGRTLFRFETEYELLLTNRLILQPLVETDIYGKSDPERGLGAGLSSVDAELRLRYEFRREVAPYIGVVWNWKFFGTADFAEAAGESASSARLALGVRLWF